MPTDAQETIRKLHRKIQSLTEEVLENYEELNLMYDISDLFSSVVDYDKVSQEVLTEAIDFFEVDLGWLVVYEEATDSITSRNRHAVSLQVCSYFNAGLVWDVVQRGKPLVVNDVPDTHTLMPGVKWPHNLICVPMKTKDEVVGAITLGRYNPDRIFTAGDQKLLKVLCTQSAVAIKNAQLITNLQELYEELRRQDKIRGMLGRYLPQQLIEKIIRGEQKLTLGGEAVHATVLFADIRGFTEIMSAESPERVVNLLNQYFTVMIDCVFNQEGTLDKIMGDAVMAVFGTPFPFEDNELRAIKAGLEIQQSIRQLNEKLSRQGHQEINVGMGIASGIVLAGNVGSENRMEFTVMGDPVNLAFRVQGRAQREQVLITEQTYQLIHDQIECTPQAPISIKGKDEPIPVYEVQRVL